MWGNPLQNSGYLLQLVKLIPLRPKKLNIKRSQWGTPCKILVVIFSCAAFVGFPRETKSGFKKNRARWGNPLQNFGFLLQLVELIPRWPKKLNIKNISVGEPLAKFQLLSSVAPPLMDFLRRPRAANWIRFCDKTKFEGEALKHRPSIKRSVLLRVRLYTNLNPQYA